MRIDRLDHLVLTVRDIGVSCRFYSRILGVDVVTFGDNRTALKFGVQKINLHQAGEEIKPCAGQPTPGSADLCFIAETPIAEIVTHLNRHGVTIELGPVQRTGAVGTMQSVYIRDPDRNLIELSAY
jgi:catechol 2,3-dioxygenase-like lactoylglutathione lyase family enzyme